MEQQPCNFGSHLHPENLDRFLLSVGMVHPQIQIEVNWVTNFNVLTQFEFNRFNPGINPSPQSLTT